MQLDYLLGRRVEGVHAGGAQDATWRICLEGGAVIYVFEEGFAAPDAEQLHGLAFNSVDTTQPSPKLYFGTNENPTATVVNLPAGQFGISDDQYTKGEIIDPSTPPVEQAIPPDPEELRQQETDEAAAQEGKQVLDTRAQADDTSREQAHEERNG